MKNLKLHVLFCLALLLIAGCTPNEPPAAKYTVTFNTDGGSSVASVEVEKGAKVNKPATPTRSGYKFVNWYKDETKTEIFNFSTETIIGSITIYAKWEKGVYFTEVGTYSANDINLYLTLYGLSSAPEAKSNITIYKHEYKTASPYNEQDITVSGLVIIPDGITQSDVISYQHGTIFKNRFAPSEFSTTNPTMSGIVIAYLSSLSGHITIAPDYIGYGSSTSTFHPYIHLTSTAKSVVDMILSVQENVPKQFSAITMSKNTSLLGYSEGGYATIATSYYLATNASSYANKITLKRCIPMAAVYSPKLLIDEAVATNVVSSLHNRLFAFAMLAYNRLYNIYNNITSLFVPSVGSKMPAVYTNLAALEDDITPGETLDGFFSASLISDVRNANSTISQKAQENGIPTSWVPSITINVLHSRQDDLLPITQVRWFAQHSGKSATVTYDTTDIGTHQTGYIPIVIKASSLILQTHN